MQQAKLACAYVNIYGVCTNTWKDTDQSPSTDVPHKVLRDGALCWAAEPFSLVGRRPLLRLLMLRYMHASILASLPLLPSAQPLLCVVLLQRGASMLMKWVVVVRPQQRIASSQRWMHLYRSIWSISSCLSASWTRVQLYNNRNKWFMPKVLLLLLPTKFPQILFFLVARCCCCSCR